MNINSLTEITTPRQALNGTRMFLCRKHGVKYGSYASGYVRRIYPGTTHKEMSYQINSVNRFFSSFTSCDGRVWERTLTKRIMIPDENDRIEFLKHKAATYKPHTYRTLTRFKSIRPGKK